MLTARIALTVGMAALTAASAWPATAEPAVVLVQGGITIEPRNDLGPRYEPYSESWKTYRPPPPCEWVTVQTRTPDGKVLRERKWGCRVPARDF